MEDGKIGGYTVAEIQEDRDLPFGVICDILVREDLRGRGIGSFLLDKALEWLRQKDLSGIYLESAYTTTPPTNISREEASVRSLKYTAWRNDSRILQKVSMDF